MRALVVAFECIPNAGSDPGLGWQWVVAAAARHDVWLITDAANREAIEAEGRDDIRVDYVEVPGSIGPLHAGGVVADNLRIQRFFAGMMPIAEQLVDLDQIEVSHFVSFGAYWLPVPLHRLAVPHVFGPVHGGERIPPALAGALAPRTRVTNAVRNGLQGLLTRSPRWQAANRAETTLCIAATDETAAAMRRAGARDVRVWRPPFSLSEDQVAQLAELAAPLDEVGPARFVMSGRHLDWKGHALGVRAFAAALPRLGADAELEVIGEGPETDALRTLVAELGVDGQVRLSGKLDRTEERARIGAATAFVLPSLRDSGSTLLSVAMAMSRPVLAFRTGAVPAIVGSGAGLLVEPTGLDDAVTGLADAMVTVASDPARRSDMGAEGRRRVLARFTMSTAEAAVDEWYRDAVALASPSPT